jgi:lipopolysaccharide biosynthesis protein
MSKKIFSKFKKTLYKKLTTSKFDFNIDSPDKIEIDKPNVQISGWLIPKRSKSVKSLRVKNNGSFHQLEFGLKRADVARAYPQQSQALSSGFSGEITYTDGMLEIEVDLGRGFVPVFSTTIKYVPEKTIVNRTVPDLAIRTAEHQDLLDSKHTYYFETASKNDFNLHKNDSRIITFYLPQFHPIDQNDRAWGKGFTEWSNVASDTPRFIGHLQPILPADLGFYDLRVEETIKQQIKLAKQHGIYGFCFYYYWFSGERLLEKPLNSFLKHKDWDFNFTICWANENWTKRWDGREDDVIVAQKYSDEDPLQFIKDVEHILIDPRYIRVDGKPMLLVYRASELKNPNYYASVWRGYFKKHYKLDLHLVATQSFDDEDPRIYGFDKGLDFAPQSDFLKNEAYPEKKFPYIDVSQKLLDKDFSGSVADYRAIATNPKLIDFFTFPHYGGLTPSWDNDARKKGKGFVMYNNSPDLYALWLDKVLEVEISKNSQPTIFINAWNEWAEGAILEPSAFYGHALLNRTSEILAKYSNNPQNASNFPNYNIVRKKGCDLAVIVHLYYPERWDYIKQKLDCLDGITYDLFVSISKKNVQYISEIEAFKKDANIFIVPNRGRDVLPFLFIANRLRSAGYKQVLKVHSKKSLHRRNGKDWFEDMVNKLLPSHEIAKQIYQKISEESTIVGPSGHYLSLKNYMGSNEPHIYQLLSKIFDTSNAKKILEQSAKYGYFAGSMYWASLEAIDPMLNLHLLPEDFEAENGQIDGTLAHAVERVTSIILLHNNQTMWESDGAQLVQVKQSAGLSTYDYAE